MVASGALTGQAPSDGFFGERVAARCDRQLGEMDEPAELDLMARLAGMRLEHRWAGWGRQPFTGPSRSHVSIYGREAA